MRRGTRVLMSVTSVAVVAVALRTSVHPQTAAVGAAVVATAPRSAAPRTTAPRTTTPRVTHHRITPTTPAPTTTAPKSVTATGGVVDTQYGPVQVGVTVLGNHLTQVRTLQHPSGDGQTNRINSYAIPQLEQEAMKAGNAHLDTVSGATFTSQGYRQSLQSALDAAHGAR